MNRMSPLPQNVLALLFILLSVVGGPLAAAEASGAQPPALEPPVLGSPAGSVILLKAAVKAHWNAPGEPDDAAGSEASSLPPVGPVHLFSSRSVLASA